MIIQLSLYFSSLAYHERFFFCFFVCECIFVDAAQVLLLPRQRDIVLCHCVSFPGKVGGGVKKKSTTNGWKKKEQNGEFAILFLNPILPAQILKKKTTTLYILVKNHQ